ncbi:PAS domain S-box-containing protein [Rhodopirellula rubra]|uniref:histidine kinase n=1 Tax=Aporhodopirellula rubra TaxID=980271 RepID=A0A7W5H7A5_9BACT|nr:PAS domain S-box protein [Aporhodopirellula rubra]MBB3209437.1 PAS domain S-box-containing protein [Aporhodopirellula rubra]
MNRSKHSDRLVLPQHRIGLVWGLTAVGLSTVLLLLIASCWSLESVREDRVASDQLRTVVSEIAGRADRMVEEYGRNSATLLRDRSDRESVEIGKLAPKEMRKLLADSHQLDPRLTGIVQHVESTILRIKTLNARCCDLAMRRRQLQAEREGNICETHEAFDRLNSILVSAKQLQMLQSARAIHAYRKMSGQPAKEAAHEILQSWTPKTSRSEEVQELDELVLLHQKLLAATDPDTLVDLRDNELKQRFARLHRILDTPSQDDMSAFEKIECLNDLEVAFFGEGFEHSEDGQGIENGKGGLYNRCAEWLECIVERERLRDQHADSLNAYAKTKTRLLSRLSAITSDSALQATAIIVKGFKSIFAVGFVSVTVFLVLATKIDKRLATQFRALCNQSVELAKAKAKAEKLSLIAKFTDDAVVITGADARIEWVNDGFTRLTGYKLDEVIGLVPGHFLQGHDTNKETIEVMRTAVREERGFDVELLNYRKDGSSFWLDLHVRPIYGNDGELTNFIATQSDITARITADAQLNAANRALITQKQTLNTVVDSVSSGIVSLDYDGELLSYNAAAEAIFGEDCIALVNDSRESSRLGFYDPVTMLPIAPSRLPIRRALNGEPVRNEELLIRCNGADTVVSFNGTPFSKYDNAGAVFSFSDITERWERDLSLRRLRQGIDTASDTMIIFDSSGTIIDLNRACCEILGYERDALLGVRISKLDSVLDAVTWEDYWRELQHSKTVTSESTMTRQDGSSFPIEVSTTYGSFCGTEYACRISRDISDRKRAEREREVLAGELQDAARQAGMAELAGDVLHNVGNALTSINVSTQTLRDRIESPTCEHLVKASQVIRDNENQLGAYLSDDPRGRKFPGFLSELAASALRDREVQMEEISELMNKVEHIKEIVASQKTFSQHRSPKEPVSPTALFDEAVKMNLPSIRRHGVHVETDFETGADLLLEKHSVIQVLINLIKNAKESVVAAEVESPTIRLSIKRLDGDVVFSVEDNGLGIAPDNLIEIFRHGFTTKATGLGFGLHSSANVAQELGGSLSAESRGEGSGATFTLSVPALEIIPCVPSMS